MVPWTILQDDGACHCEQLSHRERPFGVVWYCTTFWVRFGV